MIRIEEVLEYVREKYGREYVCKIGTFGTLGAKAVLKDVARTLKYPFDAINKVTRMITDVDISIDEAMEKYPDIARMYEEDVDFAKVVDIGKRLEGLQRHTSSHAAGVIISPFPLTDIIPTKGEIDDLVSQYSMEYIELLGLVKMDFLKLRTLTIIKNTLNSVERQTGDKIKIDRIDFNDDKVFEEFQKGNTVGIFQFESPGMRALLKKMKPKSIDDLAAANALYRPGPLDSIVDDPNSIHFGKTMVEVYVARASGEAALEYDHPLLEEVQKDTHGVFVFQEQVMKSSVVLAKYTKAESDELRKVVGKKIMDKMPIQKAKFIQGCLDNELFVSQVENPEFVAEKIWNQIETFGRYGFNAAHSYSYAILAFQSMYLKLYYSVFFMAAVLTSWMGKKIEEIVPYLNECRTMNIAILPPDVNESSNRFEASRNIRGIHFGLNAIKGVGEKAVVNILEVKANHEIRTMVDFILMTNTSVNKTVTLSLIKCGAFDFLGYNRRTMLKMAEELIALASKAKQRINNNKKRKNPLADISVHYAPLYDYVPEIVEEFSLKELCDLERELTGFYMKHHPLDGLIAYIQSKATNTSLEINKGIKIERRPKLRLVDDDFIPDMEEETEEDEEDNYQPLPHGQTVITGGVIKQLQEITVRNGRSAGQIMASFIIEDAYQGDIKVTAFAEHYRRFQNTLQEGNVVFIKGSISYYREAAQINLVDAVEISRDTATKFNTLVSAKEVYSEIKEVEEQIQLAEETIELLGLDDAEMISGVCEELVRLYGRLELLQQRQKDLVA